MAKGIFGVPNMQIRGKVGDLVFLPQGNGRTVVRLLPTELPPRTALQEVAAERMTLAAAAWQALSFEEADAWRAYVQNPHPALPQGGGGVPKNAYQAFLGLATKCLQMRPDAPVPALPPTSAFLGDGLIVAINREAVVAATSVVACDAVPKRSRAATEAAAKGPSDLGTSVVTFSASAPNTPGVLTEILVQKLAGKHRKPLAKAYRTAAFVAFTNAPFELPVEPGTYACAIRFVREATGQETQIVPIGKAVVTG